MRELRLVAVSDDGGKLLLRGDAQEPEFTVRIDERLHAAIRGDRPRLGQLEIQMDSQLRPRDIQARVRAGASAESLAEASGIPLDRLLRYAGPVIAEREHMVERARRSVVRRGPEGQLSLDDTVGKALDSRGLSMEDVGWDAWRGDDGRWAVRAAWTEDEPFTGTWVLDPAGKSVSALDDFARWLSGDQEYPAAPEPPPAPATRLAVVTAFARPAEEVAPDWPELGSPRPTPEDLRVASDVGTDTDQALVAEDESGQTHVTVELEPLEPAAPEVPAASPAPRPRPRGAGRSGRLEPARPEAPRPTRDTPSRPPAAPTHPEPDTGRLRLSDIAQHIDEGTVAEPAPAAARKPRASVPSWDEIMFGKRRRGE